ncbi:hypothetical protein GCM10020220_108960 [Nonomuraea rubra]
MLRVFREDFAAGVRGLVEGGSPEGTDPALKDAYFEKMVAVRQPAGVRSIEGLVRWDMDAALREIRQPVTVFAIRELVTREAIERYGDRLEIVLVELGSHHFPVESPEGTAELLAGVVAAEAVPPEPTPEAAEHGGVEELGGAAAVELGGAAAVAGGGAACFQEEALRLRDLSVEVARVEVAAPDDLVHPAQVRHRELRRAERRSQRGVLQLGAGPLDSVEHDAAVVEGHDGERVDRLPAHVGLLRGREVGGQPQVGDAQDALAGVAVRVAVRLELLQVDRGARQARAFGQEAVGGCGEVLVELDEAAGE